MFGTFGTEARKVVESACKIATELDSSTVEAEHLLLAITREPASPAHRVLIGAGLDDEALLHALRAEFEASLAVVGVSVSDFDVTSSAPRRYRAKWGTSAKLALQRCAQIAAARRDRRVRAGHILLGVLRAPAGTVPRALEQAGVDRVGLSDRVAATL
ncbi:MAG: Clp protease N-terminal domain-containing protein [Solirubrobacteraceae bacterium]